MIGLKVSVSMDKVLERLDRMRQIARLRPVARETASALEKLYRKYTPVSTDPNQPRPGRLRAGWKGQEQVDDVHGKLLILVRNIDPRAQKVWPLLMKGTKRHAIQAVRAKMMVFRFKDNSIFYGKSVTHPGARRAVDSFSLNRDVQTELIRLRKRIAEVMVQDKQVMGPV